MEDEPEVWVVRLGHRPGRDERMTTHVGLTARALGADRVVLPQTASHAQKTVDGVTTRFGGPFVAETRPSPAQLVQEWDDLIVHLTMYGEPIQSLEADIRTARTNEALLVVVGGGKVPFSVYERADWNVAVTNQPHSEVAALAVFLDRLFEGGELTQQWHDAGQRIIPRAAGKQVETLDDDGAGDGFPNHST